MNPKIKYLLDKLKDNNSPVMFTKEETYNNHTKTTETLFFVERVHQENLELNDIAEYKNEKDIVDALSSILAKTITNTWPEN
jgi:hypothetical protein